MTKRQNAVVPAASRAVAKRSVTPVQLGRLDLQGRSVYESDHSAETATARLRWLVSTCVTGAVGLAAIGFVLVSATDERQQDEMLTSLRQLQEEPMMGGEPDPAKQRARKLRQAKRKTDQLETTTRGVSTLHVIHETERARRYGREYITIKPFGLVEARLATRLAPTMDDIPKFDAFKLVARAAPSNPQTPASGAAGPANVSVNFVQLVGGIVPAEDGQQLSLDDVVKLVAKTSNAQTDGGFSDAGYIDPSQVGAAAEGAAELRRGLKAAQAGQEASGQAGAKQSAKPGRPAPPPNTTDIAKNVLEPEAEESEGIDQRIIRVASGETLYGILVREGIEPSVITRVITAARDVAPTLSLAPGDDIHVALTASPVIAGASSLVKFAIFSAGQVHRVTVLVDEEGNYTAHPEPRGVLLPQALAAAARPARQSTQRATLYQSIFQAARLQNLPAPMVTRILRIHIFDTDFKRRVGPGDGVNIFFDMQEDENGREDGPGELLYTSLIVGGEKRGFYRFRLPDGTVDYYDQDGRSAKKFLMKKPLRDPRVVFTSGYGYRMHPILKVRRLHTGVDFAGPVGVRILAAGDGVVTKAGWRGAYGNSVIIRHANGYETTYSHLSRIARGIADGARVTQGQVIGRMGSTGRSTGSHLHFEVKLNGRFLNPSTIPVPRGRVLKNGVLEAFRRERDRIDELMRRTPVRTRIAQASVDRS